MGKLCEDLYMPLLLEMHDLQKDYIFAERRIQKVAMYFLLAEDKIDEMVVVWIWHIFYYNINENGNTE